MKYPYIVNKDGVWYPAGTEVPTGTTKENGENHSDDKKPFTKTEISRMSTADLRNLADKQGIEFADKMNGADLKKVLIEQFGL